MLKCAEREEDAYAVRVFNASGDESEAVMEFGGAVESAQCVNLNEEPIENNAAETKDNKVTVPVGAWQIVTVSVKLEM